MTQLEIHTTQVRQVGNDLANVAAAIAKGIGATQVVQELVSMHWIGDDRAQRIHMALRDWTEVAPSIQTDMQGASDFLLNTVAPTYEKLGQ